jgi:hypothetical protein
VPYILSIAHVPVHDSMRRKVLQYRCQLHLQPRLLLIARVDAILLRLHVAKVLRQRARIYGHHDECCVVECSSHVLGCVPSCNYLLHSLVLNLVDVADKVVVDVDLQCMRERHGNLVLGCLFLLCVEHVRGGALCDGPFGWREHQLQRIIFSE